jgi:hypothetical protein
MTTGNQNKGKENQNTANMPGVYSYKQAKMFVGMNSNGQDTVKMITDYVSHEWDIRYMVAWMKREEGDGEEIQERPKKNRSKLQCSNCQQIRHYKSECKLPEGGHPDIVANILYYRSLI